MTILHETQPPVNPHPIAREIIDGWATLPRAERRTRLQALPLFDLVQLAHYAPTKLRASGFLTPDLAWAQFRLLMQPDPWAPDICAEVWEVGPVYVAYYAGNAIATRNEHAPLWESLSAFFAAAYPKRLIDVAMEEVCRG